MPLSFMDEGEIRGLSTGLRAASTADFQALSFETSLWWKIIHEVRREIASISKFLIMAKRMFSL